MLLSNIFNDGFGLLSKQLRFYCWHFRRNLDQRQRQELIELLYEQHFERLANKIKSINQSNIADCKQQVGKLLLEHCLTRNRRHQLVQLIESGLVDIDVRLDNYGRTLLHRSAYNLDVDLVRILIEQGVNIRLRDYAGNTALHIAIQSYRNGAVIYGNGPDVVQNLTSIIRLLLEADKSQQSERYRRKRIKLLDSSERKPYHQLLTRGFDLERGTTKTDGANSSPTNLGLCNPTPKEECNSGSSRPMTKKSPQLTGPTESEPKTSPANLGERDTTSQGVQLNYSQGAINPILLEDLTSPLVDTKNAFGRTALHYCVLVVGEQHLAQFVKLLISFGAYTDAMDSRMKSPLYCLVKRPGISAIRQKCTAISHLLESGCDDLGLALNPQSYFNDEFIENIEQNLATVLQTKPESLPEPIFTNQPFKRVPSLKHLSRLRLIRLQNGYTKLNRQVTISLPSYAPPSLNLYVNRKILDQTELF